MLIGRYSSEVISKRTAFKVVLIGGFRGKSLLKGGLKMKKYIVLERLPNIRISDKEILRELLKVVPTCKIYLFAEFPNKIYCWETKSPDVALRFLEGNFVEKVSIPHRHSKS